MVLEALPTYFIPDTPTISYQGSNLCRLCIILISIILPRQSIVSRHNDTISPHSRLPLLLLRERHHGGFYLNLTRAIYNQIIDHAVGHTSNTPQRIILFS